MNLWDIELFESITSRANNWVIGHFDWLFSRASFSFLIIICAIYLSPLGRLHIGGDRAIPILTKWKWFAISICTTIATGILFCGTAEPIIHMCNRGGSPVDHPTTASALFLLSTMFMHWTLTPYAIYCIAAIVFAIGYYNHKQSFSLGEFKNTSRTDSEKIHKN